MWQDLVNLKFSHHPAEDEQSPYRDAWSSLLIESGILLALTSLIYLLSRFFNFAIFDQFRIPAGSVLAVIPAVLWFVFSHLREQKADLPRANLILIFVLSALGANAIALPLINDLMQVDQWLPLAPAVDRIIGYTFTVGIIQEGLKYLILRYTVWTRHYRIRQDGIAYGVTAAHGFALILNMHYIATIQPSFDVAAIHIFGTFALQIVASMLLAYGLVETVLSRSSPFLLPFSLLTSALISGIAIPLQTGLPNAALSVDGAGTRPLFGFVFSIALLLALPSVVAFLFRSQDRREQDVKQESDE